MSVDNYCVFYIPNKETRIVDIVRVMYTGSDLDKHMTEYANEN